MKGESILLDDKCTLNFKESSLHDNLLVKCFASPP